MRSFLADYDLEVAGSLSDAVRLVAEGWRPLAGGTDVMVLFNAGQLPFRKLVSIRRVAELRRLAVADDYVTLGAGLTYTEIRNEATVRQEFPLLALAAGWTGGIANQNRGTLGGNIVNASPAADSSPALLVYNAELELRSARGERRVPYREFHTGYKTTQLQPDELVTAIHLPRPGAGLVHHARKAGTRKAQAISKVAVAATARLEQGVFHAISIALASVAPVPLWCRETEQALAGERNTAAVRERALSVLASEVRPISDIRSTGIYRQQVSVNLLREFLEGLR